MLLCDTVHLHNSSLLSSLYNILERLKHCRCWYEMVHAIPVPIVDWLQCPLSQLGFCRRSHIIPTAWLSQIWAQDPKPQVCVHIYITTGIHHRREHLQQRYIQILHSSDMLNHFFIIEKCLTSWPRTPLSGIGLIHKN